MFEVSQSNITKLIIAKTKPCKIQYTLRVWIKSHKLFDKVKVGTDNFL